MQQDFTRAQVTLGNWRFQPYSRWSYHNVADLVPSAVIPANRRAETPTVDLGALAQLPVRSIEGNPVPLPAFLTGCNTDAFVVMRRGTIVGEWYAGHYDPARPHIIFSVTKSVTGLLAAILVDQGKIAYDDRIGTILPDMVGSAYEDATLQQVLDMQVSVVFEDDHLDVSGMFDRYRRSMLWNPEKLDDPTPDMRAFLTTVRKAEYDHGTRHRYHSINTDLAGIALEVAGGGRFGDLVSELIWKPMGAYSDGFITVDRAGWARAAGGMSVTARDLARMGELVRLGGAGVVPEAEIDRIYRGGDKAVWAAGDQAWLLDNGSYRSCFYDNGVGGLSCMGIHGQWVWIDRATETVIVRMSCEGEPVTEAIDHAVMDMLRAVSAA